MTHKPTIDWKVLQARSRLLQEARSFFLDRDFVEVDTPLLSHDTMVDRFIDPIEVPLQAAGGEHRMYLQTSPEFGMKRLLGVGAKRIFQLGKVFRQGEAGRHHQPEFTMLEWYRVGDSYEQGRALLDTFVQQLLEIGPARQWTYQQAFQELAGVDPFESDDSELIRRYEQSIRPELHSTRGSPPMDRDEILNRLISDVIEPALAGFESMIIYDWPASQAALSQVRAEPGIPDGVAERFELYVRGVELANGYHELTNADEWLRRARQANALRVLQGKSELPVKSQLLQTMKRGMPASCGTALGFDRLAMLALGKTEITQVVPFPFESA